VFGFSCANNFVASKLVLDQQKPSVYWFIGNYVLDGSVDGPVLYAPYGMNNEHRNNTGWSVHE